METNHFRIIAVIGAIILIPTVSLAAQVQPCPAGTASNITSQAAFDGLKQMRYEAMSVSDHALKLQDLATDQASTGIDKEPLADQLTQIRHEVNQMGRQLCRLQTLGNEAAPWERSAVHQLPRLVQAMAGNTDFAMQFVNAHQNGFWMPSFTSRVSKLNREAKAVAHDIRNDERIADGYHRATPLENR